MYLHLGSDIIIRNSEIVGIFDIEGSSVSKLTREFLGNAQKKGMVVEVSSEMPKSFVVCKGKHGTKVHIAQVSPATLARRFNQ